MKILSVGSVALTIIFAFPQSTPVHAQFLKKMINSVKQAAQGKANNNADSALQAKPTRQFAGDTSAAGEIKPYGLSNERSGVSAADSAAAVETFMTASGGSGIFYQYITTTTTKRTGTFNDTMAVYLASNGNGRSEMSMNTPGTAGSEMIIIGRAGQPKYSITLNPDSKTYSLNLIDTSLINSGIETYQVTRIGTETIQGYSCIHSKITSSLNSEFGKSSAAFDIWTSTEVPGYSLMKKLMMVQNVQPKMMKALDQAGCGGFFVKFTSVTKEYSMSMLLAKAESRSFPASLFEIPEGYTESKENVMYHMPSQDKKQ